MKRDYLIVIIALLIVYLSLFALTNYQYQREVVGDRQSEEQTDADALKANNLLGQNDLNNVVADLRIIKELPAFTEYIANPSLVNKARVQKLFYELSHNRALYDQMRFIDENGQEIIRVNFSNGTSTIVADKDLQNKKDRYYFKEAMAVKDGQFYVSPLDLNVENNKVEVPYKPMLRFAMPIYGNGKARGIIILNYLAQSLIDDLASVKHLGQQHLSFNYFNLINDQGFWLHSADQSEWGFMFPNKQAANLSSASPDVWAKMKSSLSGQFYTADGFYSYITVYAATDQNVSWKLYIHKLNPVIYANSNKLWNTLLLLNVLFFAFLAVVGLLLLKLLGRLELQTERSKQSESKFRGFVESTKDAVVIMNSKSQVVLWNKAAEAMFGYNEKEVMGKEFHPLIVARKEHKNTKNLLNFGKTGESTVLGKNIELPVKHKDGHEFMVELSVSRTMIGKEWYAIGVMRDITDRKKNEDALRKADEEIKSALAEAERLNRLTVNREIKMIELKNQLAQQNDKLNK
ncbi:MAG: PAS domain S-box protein [Candidatus Falkowbacteria bacterium]